MKLTFRLAGTREIITLNQFRTFVAGYTGRDVAAVNAHINELAAIGVAPPPAVPMFYPVDSVSVSSDTEYVTTASHTSGEVEPVYIRHASTFYLGVGSDHTDRELERLDVGDSKRSCPKPMSQEVVRIGSDAELAHFSLDRATARCCVDGRLYQEGSLATLRAPHNLIARLTSQIEIPECEDFVCFGGTLPLLNGAFIAGELWHIEIKVSPDVSLTHNYRMRGHTQ